MKPTTVVNMRGNSCLLARLIGDTVDEYLDFCHRNARLGSPAGKQFHNMFFFFLLLISIQLLDGSNFGPQKFISGSPKIVI